MKKTMYSYYMVVLACLTSTLGFGQTDPGDIAFTGFNTDGNDDFAFVTLVDIPANTSIWFTDNEWDGDSFNNLNEGEIEWTHSSIVPAGTVIIIESTGGSSPSANLGSANGGQIDLAGSNEQLFALLTEPSGNPMPTPGFLAGISNDLHTTSLSGTGLTLGVDFLDFNNDNDGFEYQGPISGQTSFADYLPLIMNTSNWQIESSDGTAILPIADTPFTIISSTDTTVQFTSASASVTEDAGTYDLEFSITNADATNATTFDVVLTTGDITDIDNYTTQSVTYTAGSTTNQIVTITITNDAIVEPIETLEFNIQNVTGGNNATIGSNNTFSLSITDNDVVQAGDIMITEIMYNPSLSGNPNEYFEVYNTTGNPIDLNGWEIGDDGIDDHIINSSVVVPAYGFAVFGSDANITTNDGVTLDYEYSSIALANGADEIILTNLLGLEIDRVEYDDSSPWPSSTSADGAALIYTGTANQDNNDGSLWSTATVSEGIDTDFGSPGSNGTDQIIAFLVYEDSVWTTTPTTATGARSAVIINGEYIMGTDVNLDIINVQPGAALNVPSGLTLDCSDLNLNSSSTSFSSLILDGTVTGNIHYHRYTNPYTNNGINDDNDLIAPPVEVASFSDFASSNSGILLASGSLRAFAPFDKTAGAYVNLTDTDTQTLTPGTGYRAATDPSSSGLLTFTGTPVSGDLTGASGIDIVVSGPEFGLWNLIGNPYPSYVDINDFLNHLVSTSGGTLTNLDLLDNLSGVYGYDGDASDGWDIITLANSGGRLFAPGQGFFVAADATQVAAHNIEFTQSMRRTGTTDDFIMTNRDSDQLVFLELKASTANNAYYTEFYFDADASLGLDPGYDATVFGGNAPSAFALYSHLVQGNTGLPFALQALGSTDISNVTIPLGLNANAGEQLTFTIESMSIPNGINVYLEDQEENTFTLLNTNDYVLTPSNPLNGTGRFYINFTNSVLSTNTNSFENLQVYANNSQSIITVSGILAEESKSTLFDVQGRVVANAVLEANTSTQSFSVAHLKSGIYIVHINNSYSEKTVKVILN